MSDNDLIALLLECLSIDGDHGARLGHIMCGRFEVHTIRGRQCDGEESKPSQIIMSKC